ncbi:MAG TPA: PrsW family intramembrane metalloprotease, partial [Chloroflexi bacterium]|nr:PrsW family intramembrane metalloprotease [Chloroflexota bacterium]
MATVAALFLSLQAALIPTVVYVAVVWWFDRYEREPFWLLAITFIWGAIPAIVLALVLELLFDLPIRVLVTPEGADFIGAALLAPAIEECVKALPLAAIFLFYRREFDGVLDGLLYGALVGFGFAMTENIFYFLGAFFENGWSGWGLVVFLRAVIFGLNHALFTAVTGAALGYSRYALSRPKRLAAPFLGLGGAIVLHATHNAFVATGTAACLISLLADWLGVLAVGVVALFAARTESRLIMEELREEVGAGLLTPGAALAAASFRRRWH